MPQTKQGSAVTKLSAICFSLCLSTLVSTQLFAVETMPPPELGEETKGTPAQVEETTAAANTNDKEQGDTKTTKLNNNSKVTEYRRSSGQIYRLEFEHSATNRQYIEETDSDGHIESTNNDIEDTPNLPKWKIGTW